MDSLQFDGYTSYSDSSTPRTPSPQDVHFIHSPHYKPTLDIEPRIYGEHGTDPAAEDGIVPIVPGDAPYWNGSAHPPPHFSYNSSRGSLLQELYDHDIAEQHTHSYMEQSAEPSFHGAENWSPQQTSQLQEHQRRHPDYTMVRRATFPYVRQDRGDAVPMQSYPPFIQHHQQDNFHSFSARPDNVYGSSLSLSSEPSEGFVNPHSQPYHDYDDNPSIKLEDNGSMMVPSQTGFYRPQSASPLHNGMTMSYLSPHTGLPVQHTDDAASKETQYLRRRCFNCHTTEPPSWRRSTLNPGKIVCNKCGLYERTHLRPRPLRFDELRAGNKARKASKGTVSPKATKIGLVKKEPREFGLVRRSSVSSSSSVHSGSGASDWDDNVSVYSAGSAPPTSFNSPNAGTFPLSRDSQSPPRDPNAIRLPPTPLSDIASPQLQQQLTQSQPLSLPMPRKSHTAPYYTTTPPNSAALVHSSPLQQQQQQTYYRSPVLSEVELSPRNGNTLSPVLQNPVPAAA